MIYQAILIYLVCTTGEIFTACPIGCSCDRSIKVLSCYGWKDARPPNVSNADSYESLDLSSDNGIKYLETECIDSTQVKARSGVSTRCQPGPGGECSGEGEPEGGGLLGDALEAGRLPGSWLGIGRFMFLKRLRLRRAGLRLVHKDAFRYQLKLRCVDLSHNHLQRLNLFTWQRHDELYSLLLAGNAGLKISVDTPMLYSKSLRMLDLSGCQLTSLHFCAFDGVPSLKKLDLSNNNLKTMSSSREFPRGLIHLNMSSNNMKYLSCEIAEHIMNISEVTLNNNPWECDCHLMETWMCIRNLTSEETFELLCSDRFSYRSWNEVFEKETCEMLTTITTNAVPTTEAVHVVAVDNKISVEENSTTEEIIYRGEANEVANNPIIHVIISGTIILLFQIMLYVSIWRKVRVSGRATSTRISSDEAHIQNSLVEYVRVSNQMEERNESNA